MQRLEHGVVRKVTPVAAVDVHGGDDASPLDAPLEHDLPAVRRDLRGQIGRPVADERLLRHVL